MSNRKKAYLLFLGLFILIWMSWRFGISKTLDVYKRYAKLKAKTEEINSRPVSIGQMKKQIFVLDSLIKVQNLKEGSFHQRLLQSIEDVNSKEKINILHYNRPHVFKKGNYTIQTAMITVEGNFISLLKYIYYLEQKARLGSIYSVTFKKSENRKTRKKYLQATIYIQYLSKNTGYEN